MSADPRPTVAILTLGCKLNQAESQALARELLAHGCRVVQRPEPGPTGRPTLGPDAYVINSCSVTHVADRKSRHLVRLARRLSPDAIVVLAGCYAESGGPDLAERTGADLVLRNGEKASLAQELLRRLGDGSEARAPAPADDGLRTRALVKIQEGCNDVCSFCIVPRTRGRERSVPIELVVSDVLARQAEGVQEVVLTGTQLGDYGRDLGAADGPAPLLAALLTRTAVPRVRLSSVQAQDIGTDLLRPWDDPRLCRHFHLPLQSGSDRVLTTMRRRYTARQFLEAASVIRDRVPDVAITTDVMVGFPGETEADFRETYRLCQEVGFAAIHVFPYSRRPGTAAALMREQVSPAIKRERLEQMLALARASAEAFRARFEGRTMAVLWEEARRRGARTVWQGLTSNYLRVYTDAEKSFEPAGAQDLTNRILPARLTGAVADGLLGVLG